MKTITLLGIFTFVSMAAIAQVAPSRHQFRIGIGTVFVGSGDMLGLTFRNEYEYGINRRLSVAASINHSNTANEIRGIGEKTFRRIKNFTTLDATAMLKAIDSQHFKLQIGGGISLKRELSNDPAFVGFRTVSPQVDPSGVVIDYRYAQSLRTWSLGWTLPISAALYFNRWSYQLRPVIHSFADGEINTSVTVGVGYGF